MQTPVEKASTLSMPFLLQQRNKMSKNGRKKYVAFINSVITYKLRGCERNDNPIKL